MYRQNGMSWRFSVVIPLVSVPGYLKINLYLKRLLR
jgi:hypothetical protein